ncbi:4a-hydroxytetrahydrobiopterin dehydratase [filamentous cyanobacterium CCT1]|nr:4a-hydroxytetrahydrobiopterin dehydratase [filamentous cyanobacterium CCT1]PSN80507.1 4a-hydroxytetrahydrobiopterin dehydratase [filamentous cyanobacterium CCP4]
MGLSAKRSSGGSLPRRCRFGLRVAALAGSLLVETGALPAAAPPDVPSGWSRAGDRLITVCQFVDFAAAVAFVQRLVEPADRLGHHPDVVIAYNRLTLSLTTHDAGGLTSLDFALAREIADLHDGQCQPPSPPSAL